MGSLLKLTVLLARTMQRRVFDLIAGRDALVLSARFAALSLNLKPLTVLFALTQVHRRFRDFCALHEQVGNYQGGARVERWT